MKIEYLRYVTTVARLGSISAAANELWLGQSSLSMAIKNVEKELNITIFTRTTRGIIPTSKGALVIAEMEKILESYQALNGLSEGTRLADQQCIICCYPGLCPSLGPFLSSRISGDPDNITLKMKSILSRQITHALVSGTANIGIGSVTITELANERNFASVNNLAFEEVYEDDFTLCVGKDSALADRECIDVGELKNTKLCSASFAPQFTGYYPSMDFRQFKLHSVFDIEECVKRTIIENDVATFIPSLCMKDDIYVKSGMIKLIKLTGFDTRITNFIVSTPGSNLTGAEKKALETTRQFFRAARDSIG